MKPIPLTLKQANQLVESLHRHHKPVTAHRFSIGATNNQSALVGAVIVARPVARNCDQYKIAEVTRLVTDGSKNACSFLYAVAARVCREMGFTKIQTYIPEFETGVSLLAAGWEKEGALTSGGSWNRLNRGGRREDQPQEPKQKWVKRLG